MWESYVDFVFKNILKKKKTITLLSNRHCIFLFKVKLVIYYTIKNKMFSLTPYNL